ncbi:MAG TPA: Eco57I restriction-modification methylase domain-containing protein [Candidatus Bacteroides avicola]|uniref:site-specific DNA-methyltransferase (adenine-specific) n=1 Tax=Candidatus Bacteroides avicola TaxID=2838468 RepID=A0A9D2HW17_9BACE|nr:restriction endonuclease [Bacteroidales bacterium SW292]HJA85122.1 Eco57I restriction-modification methylase domain-containing protein [Candidatus Bacteroides avicola]
MQRSYNPDVLSCLANLSNDEVFTPPQVVNRMLDMLPPELWSNPQATFLDPVCKTGVFLREVAKRLMVGLADRIPDVQERVNHIMTCQLFGLAITELTSLLSRRSVYCSKWANSKYSVCTAFADRQGNIRYTPMQHTWEQGRCRYCGASQNVYDRNEGRETYAYQFIHTLNPEKIFDMKFDVIIGNPPYQLEIGIEKDNYSIPLYHKFVEQAKKLCPKYLTMIIPSRWFAGGRGLDDFRKDMLSDNRLKVIVDYPDATECFTNGIDLSGGVCYFLWDKDYHGNCRVSSIQNGKEKSTMFRPLLENNCDTFIRFNEAVPILHKIQSFKEKSFSQYVSPQTPFGIISSFSKYQDVPFQGSVELLCVKGKKYIDKAYVTKNKQWIGSYKIYISKSYGERGAYPYRFLAKPMIGYPESCCTQTYLMLGPFNDEKECKNVISYIHTRFFRFCVMLKKNTQDAMRNVYSLVPLQDFSHPWTDEMLYQKYGLTDEEIAFVESMIRPMD